MTWSQMARCSILWPSSGLNDLESDGKMQYSLAIIWEGLNDLESDGKMQYSLAIIWEGLNDLESDGKMQYSLAIIWEGLSDLESDGKMQYSLAIIWEGLNDLAYRDAVRENDWPAIISGWGMANTILLNKNHVKYMHIGHRLLNSKYKRNPYSRLLTTMKHLS